MRSDLFHTSLRQIVACISAIVIYSSKIAYADSINLRADELKRAITESISGNIDQFSNDETELNRALSALKWHVNNNINDNTIKSLTVSPEDAFLIEHESSGWKISVRNAPPLYEIDNTTNTLRSVTISVEYSFADGGRKGIRFENSSACVNTLSYFQKGGRPVNLRGLLGSDQYDAHFNLHETRELLRQDVISGNQVIYTRLKAGAVYVILSVTYKPTGEIQTITHLIPECGIPPKNSWWATDLSVGTSARFSIGRIQRSGSLGLLYSIRAEKFLVSRDFEAIQGTPWAFGGMLAAGYVGDKASLMIGLPITLSVGDNNNLLGIGVEARLGIRITGGLDIVAMANLTSVTKSSLGYGGAVGISVNLGRPSSRSHKIAMAPEALRRELNNDSDSNTLNNPNEEMGILAITSKPSCLLTIDGTRHGITPQPSLRIPVGRHRIILSNIQHGISDSFDVDVYKNKTVEIFKDYSERPNKTSAGDYGEIQESTSDTLEKLTKELVREGYAKIKPNVMKCGDANLASGDVKLSVRIAPDGSVNSVTVLETPDEALGQCAANEVKSAKLPRSVEGGTFTLSFTFGAP